MVSAIDRVQTYCNECIYTVFSFKIKNDNSSLLLSHSVKSNLNLIQSHVDIRTHVFNHRYFYLQTSFCTWTHGGAKMNFFRGQEVNVDDITLNITHNYKLMLCLMLYPIMYMKYSKVWFELFHLSQTYILEINSNVKSLDGYEHACNCVWLVSDQIQWEARSSFIGFHLVTNQIKILVNSEFRPKSKDKSN